MLAIRSTDDGWDPQLEAMYREHYPALVRAARRTVRCDAIAEEIVQDAFVTFHSRACHPRPGKELAYLRTMVVNQSRTAVRRAVRGRELTVPDGFTEPGPEETAVDRSSAAEVRAAVADLPSRQQQVLTLRYQHGLSEAEIADFLGISRGSVKVHSSRGREALRTGLSPLR
ncbi:MAG: sigma-70 family RNA polymerase sigma factor [Actinomycetota bacterium]